MDNKPTSPMARAPGWAQQLQAARRTITQVLRRYADWLAAQSWKRLAILAFLSIVAAALLSEIPPFSTRWGSDITVLKPPKPPKPPAVIVDGKKQTARSGVELQIDEHGVRIRPHDPSAPASAASESSAPPVVVPLPPGTTVPDVDIKLPPGADRDEVRQAIQEAREAIREAVDEAQSALDEAHSQTITVHAFRLGEHMVSLVLVVIVASIIAKVMGTGRKKAEVQAAVATERAESESLKRQVVEARMAAMQAQVEPHFLFNTLASIDHLIETDPGRASQMQKNLIALLRASMPTMRETQASGVRELAREMAVVRPYLEILKVRMEERLQTEIDVPEGLQSAEFPPMMIQSLVENAIKHGLEPKAEGGRLTVRAEIRHGKLCITVADTGLGFGKAATAGTGVGLANIRERLQLLYGSKATLTVTENQPSGTIVTITVPYTHRNQEGA